MHVGSTASSGSASPVVVAIDYGTYGCGFAWAIVNEQNADPMHRQINLFTQWPSQAVAYPKAMSCLLINRQGRSVAWGHEAYRMWRGRRANPDLQGFKLVRGYKMSLNPERRPPTTRGLMAINDREKRANKLIAHYLHEIYAIAVREIGKRGYSPSDIRWCITVPAMWNDYEKQVMRRAAEAAGISGDKLSLTYEPEAAAYYARVAGVKLAGRADNDRMPPTLDSPGCRFIVADCGGGTVDLTAFQTDDDGGFSEISRSDGAAAGSYYLNEAFRRHIVIPRLGGKSEYSRLCKECPQEIEDLIETWERMKVDIPAEPIRPMLIPLTHALFNQLHPDTVARLPELQDGHAHGIAVSPSEIRDLFESVLHDLLSLVDRQLAEIADGDVHDELVLLVGGFANSPYLQQRMVAHLEGRATVLVVPNPAAAVLIGAAHHAYDPSTNRRRTKFTYGVDVCGQFEPARDPLRLRIESWDGEVLCNDRFSVFVRAGDSIGADEVRRRSYLPVQATGDEMEFDIYRTRERAPRYIDDPGCKRIGVMRLSLHDVMHLDVDKRGADLEMRFGDTEITAIATLCANGYQVTATVEFNQDRRHHGSSATAVSPEEDKQ